MIYLQRRTTVSYKNPHNFSVAEFYLDLLQADHMNPTKDFFESQSFTWCCSENKSKVDMLTNTPLDEYFLMPRQRGAQRRKKTDRKKYAIKKKKKEKKQLRSFVDREQRLFHLAWAHSRLHAENLLF